MGVSEIGNIAQNTLIEGLNSSKIETDNGTAFENLLSSAINMYKEADDLQNAAEKAEMNFVLGYSNSIVDLADAQNKADLAIQYTTKVTNKALEAFKELMNMQV